MRLILILAAAAAIAFALLSADKYGMANQKALIPTGSAFAGGLLAGVALLMKGKKGKQ